MELQLGWRVIVPGWIRMGMFQEEEILLKMIYWRQVDVPASWLDRRHDKKPGDELEMSL